MCKGKVALTEFWSSLYNDDVLKEFTGPKEFFGPIALMKTAVHHLTDVSENYRLTQASHEKLLRDLESKNKLLSDLQEKLNQAEGACQSCEVLTKELKEVKRRAHLAEIRVDQIANILSKQGTELQSTDLLSQLIGGESPRRKKTCKKANESFCYPETVDLTPLPPEPGIVIPATELQKSPIKVTSKKTLVFKSDEEDVENTDPTQIEGKSNSQRSPVKVSFDLGVQSVPLVTKEEGDDLSASLLDYVHCSRQVAEEIWFTPEPEEPMKETWKLKGGLTREVNNGRKLKQTILSVARPSKIVDITSVTVPTSPEHDDDDEDIILSSPVKSQNSLMSQSQSKFAPIATSTQFDEKSTASKIAKDRTLLKTSFAYKGKTVRGKERTKLPGWDCDSCRKYYEFSGGTDAKAKMNICSRHRSKHPLKRQDTPPGYWDVDMPSTQEAKRMYTSIHQGRR